MAFYHSARDKAALLPPTWIKGRRQADGTAAPRSTARPWCYWTGVLVVGLTLLVVRFSWAPARQWTESRRLRAEALRLLHVWEQGLLLGGARQCPEATLSARDREAVAPTTASHLRLYDSARHFNSVLNTPSQGRAALYGTSTRRRGRPTYAYGPRLLERDGSTGEWYLPRDGRPPQPRAVRVWRVNNESTAQLMVWTTTSMQIRYQPPAWITPQLSGKLRARGEIRVHAGSCWHQLRNLTLAVGASHNASAACHANVRLLIDYFDETMGNAASMWAGAPLAVVRPFTLAQLSAVESSLELWGRPWACPCTNATTSRPVDLIYYFNGDDASGAELLARLSRRGIPACFRHVQLVAANVPSHEDRHPDGTCFQFYAMFCDPLFMERYAHAFVMEPDVTPLRPGWLDAVLKHARSSDAWMQGSSSRCHGQYAFNDLHLNGNAIYALRSRNFRRFLERVQRRFPPAGHVRFAPGCSGGRGGFDHSLHQLAVEEALAEPTHWRGTWRRRFVGDHTPVVNYCKQAYRPWEVLLEADNEHAYLVHSQWGVQRDVWDPAAYAMRFPDEAVVAFLRKWSAEPFPLPSSFRRFIRQGRHR
ncbi:hypothetical protein CDCA_CDCA10G2877 [Cyanidium caldarium]|uniref:Uncharacterized protein n=1 Tax=Cyanidium caldarium TaxID=2771 RepID=A0AAV9IWZ4_CYACA|nr:hypothetical protein CDCA_CDCA10G2877 [Cyanidium caldarium]